MVDQEFLDQHNMVAYLERTDGNAEFHQIVDFLTTSSIHYALTQIHATVDGKTVVISESSVTSDLHFNDEDVEGEGSGQPTEPQPPSSTTPPSQVTTVTSQPQKTHTPRRAKRGQDTKIPQSSGLPKKVGDEAVYIGEDDRVVRAATTATSLEAEQESGSGPRCQDTTLGNADAQTRVLALEHSKAAQDLVIKKLQKKVKRLENKQRARTPGMKLFKIGTSRRKS
ncbi:hypothetical protein Tco_1341893 [Tanacetum coccineum]